MAVIAKRYQDELERIKQNIEKSCKYFEKNYRRWHNSKWFIYVSSLSTDDLAVLERLKKPQLEFNILESYIDRQKGEFSKQLPSLYVSPEEGAVIPEDLSELIEGYVREKEHEMRTRNVSNEVYDDMMSGGFGVMEVSTDYKNEMSFEQDIFVKQIEDPTLCGFDPMAKELHKGDGEYAFKVNPVREEDFKTEYPDIDVSKISYTKTEEGYNWSYQTSKENVLLVVDYYEKKKKRVKIVKLSNDKTMTAEDYDKFLVDWETSGKIEQAPIIVGKPRFTTLTTIVLYKVIENQIIEHVETKYRYLPFVFYDGKSVTTKTNDGMTQQITRPYFYQAQGAQRLKNFCGQTLANEVENMVQHKFMVPKEGIPNEYSEAFTDPQSAATMIYNQFWDNNPDVRLDPPQAVPRVPIPQEVISIFMGLDQATQAILGTYDAALGINKNQLSGIAIQEGATQSNATAMPLINNFMTSLNQVGRIIVDLVPKYIITPRNITIRKPDQKPEQKPVNTNSSNKLDYNPMDLKVDVKAGVNFEIQKNRNMEQMALMAQTFPAFADFINTVGLPVLLDNLEIRGGEQLRQLVPEYQKMKQQQQQQGQQADPNAMKMQIEQQKLQQTAIESQRNAQLRAAEISVKNKDSDTNRLKALADIHTQDQKNELTKDKITEERVRSAVEMGVKVADMSHRHNKDVLDRISSNE